MKIMKGMPGRREKQMERRGSKKRKQAERSKKNSNKKNKKEEINTYVDRWELIYVLIRFSFFSHVISLLWVKVSHVIFLGVGLRALC